ncbi:MAG: inorganic diphosphatase, partial [Actinomycetota bacterium]
DAIIEIPRGSQNKYEYDHESHAIKLDRHLIVSMGYPAEYGFIPDTLGGDGDPLDILVLTEYPTFPGCHIEVKLIGVCQMEDESGQDAKLIGVPTYDKKWKDVSDLSGVPQRDLDRIRHFFTVYKDLDEGKWVKVTGWEGPESAERELAESIERFKATA